MNLHYAVRWRSQYGSAACRFRFGCGLAFAAMCMVATGLGCTAASAVRDDASIRLVAEQIVVLPVYTDTPTSGFPINARNVICSAHALQDYQTAAVAGYPMIPVHRTQYARASSPAIGDDWVVLASKYDRWKYNDIAPDAQLAPGDTVYFAGYPADDCPNSPLDHVYARPTIIAGIVKPAEPGDPPNHIRAAVLNQPIRGMSGGPAAILGDDNRVKIVGVVTRKGVVRRSLFELEGEIGFDVPTPSQWYGARNILISPPDETKEQCSYPLNDYRGTVDPGGCIDS